jgi:UrcA family protein
MTKSTIIAAIALVAALPAAAQTPARSEAALTVIEAQIDIPVSTQGLDLSNPADLQQLQGRIATARHAACNTLWRDQSFAAHQINTCLADTDKAARAQVATAVARLQLASRADTTSWQARPR